MCAGGFNSVLADLTEEVLHLGLLDRSRKSQKASLKMCAGALRRFCIWDFLDRSRKSQSALFLIKVFAIYTLERERGRERGRERVRVRARACVCVVWYVILFTENLEHASELTERALERARWVLVRVHERVLYLTRANN
jgi:hypothetical protein